MSFDVTINTSSQKDPCVIATGVPPGIEPKAVRNPVQSMSEEACAAVQGESENVEFVGVCSDVHTPAEEQIAPPGFEPGTNRL